MTTSPIPSQRSAAPQPAVPEVAPYRVAGDTWLITNFQPAGPGQLLPVNSMVIRGGEPVVVDTGAPIFRDSVLRQVFSLVEPEDIRWIYVSHDDGDHTGALLRLLDACPKATLVLNFFSAERLALEMSLPRERMRWVGPDESFSVGDRSLHLLVPPIFDGPATRALYDDRTRVLWSVDSFAALAPSAGGHERGDVPDDLYDETFRLLNSLVSPWHQWLDEGKYGRHVRRVAALEPVATASAHGPVLRGDAIDDAFARVMAMAGQPITQPPGQEALEEMLAAVVAEPVVALP